MLVIFEGIDCSGKTSCAEYLRKRYGFKIINFTQPIIGKGKRQCIIEQLKDYFTSLKFFNELKTADILCDRFHIGELVYPQVMRNYRISYKDMKYFKQIENELIKLDAKTFYFYANKNDLMKRFQENKKDQYITMDEIERVLNEYEDAIQNSRLHIEWINTSKLTKEQTRYYVADKLGFKVNLANEVMFPFPISE